MAGTTDVIDSNRDLWLFITGTALPVELIADELKRSHNKLTKVLEYYGKPNSTSANQLRKGTDISSQQQDFILKLAQCLDLDQRQCSDLLCTYLLRDYRGSKKELQELWSSELYSRVLTQRVREYYATERLYLLRCLTHLLSFYDQEQHPYMSAFAEVVQLLYSNEDFIDRVTNQYTELSQQSAPSWTAASNIAIEKLGTDWLVQNLREQCELLEVMLLYYRNAEHKLEKLHRFLKQCRRQGFGHCQSCKHLIDESCEPLLRRIGFLQVLIIVEALELEKYVGMPAADNLSDDGLEARTFEALSEDMIELGDTAEHGPLLLMWSAVTQLHSDLSTVDKTTTSAQKLASKLGKRALQRNALEYLSNQLSVEPFCGKTVVSSLSHGIIYGLILFVLDRFHEGTLGDNQSLLSVIACLLQRQFIAEDFWGRGLDEGLGSMLQFSLCRFPLAFNEPVSLFIALAKAGRDSASQVVNVLQNLQSFTEHLDKSTDVRPVADDQTEWALVHDRVPSGMEETEFVIPRGTHGQINYQLIDKGTTTNVIRWNLPYCGWDVLLGEVQILLSQIACGAGMVQMENVHRVTLVCRLLSAILSAHGRHVLEDIPQCEPLIDKLYHVVHRFSILPSPSLDLISACLDVFTQLVPFQAEQVWFKLKQTGFLPYLTQNLTDMAQTIRVVNGGAYGNLLAGCECIMGRYPLTESLLQLVLAITMCGIEYNELMALILFINQQVFPVLHKFRYYNPRSREKIGRMCLNIFNKILNSPSCENLAQTAAEKQFKLSTEHVLVQSLLFTEASRTLLEVINAGTDAVEMGLASQGSAFEGTGIDLIELICSAMSTVNRLLQLWPVDAARSPIAQTLSVRPVSRTERHLVTTIAQYIHHRVNSQLPCLATRLLKTLASLFPMSLLACLGSDAESIRDIYLMRLNALTEDVELKVNILEWLSTCVETQPGVIEMFLDIEFDATAAASSKGLHAGKSSCLQTVLNLISVDNQDQGDIYCPPDLLCAATGFIHALWKSQQQAAMAVLRNMNGFWRRLCLCLHSDLQPPADDSEQNEIDVMKVRTRSNVFRILALELYQLNSGKIDEPLITELKSFITKQRLTYWSQYIVSYVIQDVSLPRNPSLYLLLGWRDFMVVLSSSKQLDGIVLKDDTKAALLSDFLHFVEVQFESKSFNKLRMKLASNASSSYLMVLRHWCRDVLQLWLKDDSLKRLCKVLHLTYTNNEIRTPPVQIALLASSTLVLQESRAMSTSVRVDKNQLLPLIPVVCSIIQMSTNQIEIEAATGILMSNDAKYKLQIAAISMLHELIISVDVSCTSLWLPLLKDHSVIQCLLSTVCSLLLARQGPGLIQAILMILLVLCRSREGAEALAVNGINQQLCLPMAHFYTDNASNNAKSQEPASNQKLNYGHSVESVIYRLYVSLMSALLEKLKYIFVADAINFVGVHQQRMHQCLDNTGLVLTEEALLETDETCYLLSRLSHFQRVWRLEHPASLQTLMTDVCTVTQTCIGLLIRPSLLQHIVERQAKQNHSLDNVIPCAASTTPISRHLLQQSSIDDADPCTPELLNVQHRLLRVTSSCLVALRHFSPDLCDLVLSQTFDVSTYDPFIAISFGVPSVDKHQSAPSFGTLISIANLCLKLLSKIDGSRLPAASPQKPQTPSRLYACESSPIKRPIVMFVMENALMLIMTQSMRHLRDTSLSQRDKQLLKRELGAELNSFLVGLHRHLRSTSATPPSPQLGRASLGRASLSLSQFPSEQSYFKIVDSFVKQILR